MRKITILLVAAFIALISAGVTCEASIDETETVKAAAYEKITPEEAKLIMDSGKPYILLDVRTDSEFKEKHIQGAILIPDSLIISKAESAFPNKNAVILVYCRSGRRSANAAKELINLGYSNVLDFGGILSWTYETTSLR